MDAIVAKEVFSNRYFDNVPHYSTETFEAWKVADHICGGDPARETWSFKLAYKGKEKIFTASFESDDTLDVFEGTHSTPAMAICLAALRKVSYDKEVWQTQEKCR